MTREGQSARKKVARKRVENKKVCLRDAKRTNSLGPLLYLTLAFMKIKCIMNKTIITEKKIRTEKIEKNIRYAFFLSIQM